MSFAKGRPLVKFDNAQIPFSYTSLLIVIFRISASSLNAHYMLNINFTETVSV